MHRALNRSETDEKPIASICINSTFILVSETPSGSACNNCAFSETIKLGERPLCSIPDYLACRPHIRFRIIEPKKSNSENNTKKETQHEHTKKQKHKNPH